MDKKIEDYLDYMRGELIMLRAKHVFSANLAKKIFSYLKNARISNETSKLFFKNYVSINLYYRKKMKKRLMRKNQVIYIIAS